MNQNKQMHNSRKASVPQDIQVNLTEMSGAFRLTEVAQMLRVHVGSIYRWTAPRGVRGRRLRTVLIGGRRAVLPSDLETFLAGEIEVTETSASKPTSSAATHQRSLSELAKHGLIARTTQTQ